MAKYNKIQKFYPALFLPMLLSFAAPSEAEAQVYINGYLLQGQELAELESYLGSIPPGRYWLDTDTGNWSYEGDSTTIQGNIAQESNRASDRSQRGVSSYYSSGGAGGYGSYISNGKCSYFSSRGVSIKSYD